MGIVERYLQKLNREKRRWRRAAAILTVLSLVVVVGVSWNLRMTGVAIANGATCGQEEHQHTELCPIEQVLRCEYAEQVQEELPAQEEVPAEEPAETLAPAETAEPAETEFFAEEPFAEQAEPETFEEEIFSVPEEPVQQMQPEELLQLHTHTDECYETVYRCGYEEHVHALLCYSDITADVENADIWEATLPEMTGRICEDIVLVAQSQLGCGESERNFELADDGETQNGITRYGQWYGNPYGPWSNMFTSFCLRYAGAENAPIHSGAEVMRFDWETQGLYRFANQYEPVSGDIVFLDKNQNGTAEATAVVISYFDFVLTVIEGDVDNAVVLQEYAVDDPVIVGYGLTDPSGRLMMAASPTARAATNIGQTVTYTSSLINSDDSYILYTTGSDGSYYAIDGDGNAVAIAIDENGRITADVSDSATLYWNFTKTSNYDNKPTYYIQNAATGMYLHPYRDSASVNGALHSGRYGTALYTSGSGVRFRGVNQTRYARLSGTQFTIADSQSGGSVFYFGKAPTPVVLWLDGTNGDIMSYRGSDNTKYNVPAGEPIQLPSQWKSPTKYSYTLAGWVDIKTGDYYLPGEEIYVTENTVMYADWVATTYDIGRYNSYVADTVSTNDFITTHMFDYSSLINLNSTNVSVNVSSSSHSETWSHVASGNVTYKNQPTLDFSFNDHDSSGDITNLNNLNGANKYTGGTAVYAGIYTPELGEALFGLDNLFNPMTGEGIVGKHYLGQGDHLFQINTDPTSDYYGYYYYDAKLNAASYNQTDQRFYVYDYLARTSDSANNNDAGKYSDFLPLNSPYANTNGQTIKTYSYAGENGEYNGVSHYEYDARYDASGSSANQVKSNLWFGMRVDVHFGLPDTPGERLADGGYGNRDIYGNDMHFKFTGDDDVWILIDGKVALDLGGIHQAAEGDINFSTGEVNVNGRSAGTLSGVEAGEHTLSILYLERGSSMSNCAIYFNLAPRFSLTLEKEDVLTQEALNGARFAFYNDLACTDPCDLWPSRHAYLNGEAPTNIFTIQKGSAFIWGLSPSRTYYIREVAPPEASGYDPARGVICLTLDKNGLNSYSATIVEGVDENGNKVPISHGFTLHGFTIDEENQAAYIAVTNAQNWVTETTSVYVEKKWNDGENHSADEVTVYLNVTDPDGTVRRLREITLSKENDWQYTWTNLPKFIMDADTMQESDIPVQYSVSEAYIPGYSPQIEVLKNGTYTEETWAESASFKNGETYVLKTNYGCLSATEVGKDTLCYVEEEAAKVSPLALWKATVSGGLVKLTNQHGQSLTYYSSGSTRQFRVATNSTSNQNLTPTSNSGGFRLAYKSGRTSYYICAINSRNYADAKSRTGSALTFYPMVKTVTSTTVELQGYGYSIINTPLTSETALKVTKRWHYPSGDQSLYEREQVTIRLLANGVDTGRTETVSLKSNWTATFHGLPYLDDNGEPIFYTVVENWSSIDWIPVYGQVTMVDGTIPTYETVITNHYRWTDAYALPATGGMGTHIYILCGLSLMLAPLVYGVSLRRRYRKEASK